MCVQQAVRDSYASATGTRASGTSCGNAIGIRALQPDPSSRVQDSRIRVGPGRVKIIYCRVGLNFRLSCSPLIGMAFDLRTRKSERSKRLPRESCVRDRDNRKPNINLNRAIE